ncbi:hypothetical protein C8R44DRAFT_857704 [Mycena epipterygia]|nr:hypothetical protein C8R44DRAFT_857704 [Mycena epipterygia]
MMVLGEKREILQMGYLTGMDGRRETQRERCTLIVGQPALLIVQEPVDLLLPGVNPRGPSEVALAGQERGGGLCTDLALEGDPVVGAATILVQGIAEACLALGAVLEHGAERGRVQCGSYWAVALGATQLRWLWFSLSKQSVAQYAVYDRPEDPSQNLSQAQLEIKNPKPELESSANSSQGQLKIMHVVGYIKILHYRT